MNPFNQNDNSNQGNGSNFNQPPGNNNNTGNNPMNMQNQETPIIPRNNKEGSHVLDQFSLMNNMNQGQNIDNSKVSKESIVGYNPFAKDQNANKDQQNNNNFQQSNSGKESIVGYNPFGKDQNVNNEQQNNNNSQQSNIDKMKDQMENSMLGQNPQGQQNMSNNNQNSQNNMNNMQQQGFQQNSFQNNNNQMNNNPSNNNNSNDNNPQNNQNPFNNSGQNNNMNNNQNLGNNNEVNYPDLDKIAPKNIITNSNKGQNNTNSNNNQNQMSNMNNNQMNNMNNNQMNNMNNNQMSNMNNNQMSNMNNNQMSNMNNNQMSNMNMNQMNVMSNMNPGNQINNMNNKNPMSNNMNNGDNSNQMSNNNFGMQMNNMNNNNNIMNSNMNNNNFGVQMSNMNNNNPMNSNMNNNNPMNSNMNNNNQMNGNNNFGVQMSNMKNNNQMNVNEQKYSFSRYQKAAKTGLKNLGDTSYLNAVLQLLGSVRNLSSYFVNPKNKKDFESKANTIPLTYVIHRLFTHFYPYPEKPNPENYDPQVLWNVLGQYNQVYKSTNRRNPNDLINFLLINLHRELNTCKTKFMTKMDRTDKNLVIKNGLGDFGKSNNSIISNSFHWFEIKSKFCFNCKINFYDFNNYEIFELDIKGANEKYKAPFTLTDCLKNQTQKFQQLFCEKCGGYQNFTIETKIFSSPIYFIFSLNRGNLDQNLLNINFKLEEKIDITQYLDKQGAFSQYELSGVVSVCLSKNKYVCFGKSPVDKQWYIYDDSNVSNSNINEVINYNSGYGYVPCILLYSHMK